MSIQCLSLQAIGDRYWKLKVTNFDREHTATCVLTMDYVT